MDCSNCEGQGSVIWRDGVATPAYGWNTPEDKKTCKSCNGTGYATPSKSGAKMSNAMQPGTYYCKRSSGESELEWEVVELIVEENDPVTELEGNTIALVQTEGLADAVLRRLMSWNDGVGLEEHANQWFGPFYENDSGVTRE